MNLSQILSKAQDYRGEGASAGCPLCSDRIFPHNFSKYNKPLDILAKRLRYARSFSFNLDGETISNTTADGNAILSPSHTLPDIGVCTWSNWHQNYWEYTKYFMSSMELVTSEIAPNIGGWHMLNQEQDTSSLKFFFAINPATIAIHYKKLSNESFELEILDPRWIAGYID